MLAFEGDGDEDVSKSLENKNQLDYLNDHKETIYSFTFDTKLAEENGLDIIQRNHLVNYCHLRPIQS